MHKGVANNRQYNGFTPEAEDEVLRDAVSHKLYLPLVNPSNKVWRNSTQTKTLTPTQTFQIGDSLRYKNEGHNEMVDLVGIYFTDPGITKYSIKLLSGNTMGVTK